MRTVQRCQGVIRRVAGHLVQEKKRKILAGTSSDSGKDLLSLLCMPNSISECNMLSHRLLISDIKCSKRPSAGAPDL